MNPINTSKYKIRQSQKDEYEKAKEKMAERKKKNPIKKLKKNWQNMSNKDFSRKTMVSKETVVFNRMIAKMEEKILYFFICLLEL